MLILFFWESIQVLRRGVITNCFEMIFEKTLFLPTHAFVLRPSRFLVVLLVAPEQQQ